MPYPSVTFGQFLQNATKQEMEQFAALLQGYLSREHDEEGHHTDITATSVTVTGDIEAEGDVTADDATFAGNVSINTGGTSLLAKMFTHDGLLDENVTRNVSVDSTATTWGTSGADLTAAMNLRITTASGLAPKLDGLSTDTPAAGTPHGTVYRVFNVSGSTVKVVHESAVASSAAYRIACPGGVDHAVQDGGSFSLLYDATSSRWRLFGLSTAPGLWTAVAHSAGNFTSDSGSWTVDAGDQTTYAYTLVGKTMTVAFAIVTSDVGGTPTQLRIAIPGGFTAAKTIYNTCYTIDAGTPGLGIATVSASGTVIQVFRQGAAAWTTTSGDDTQVIGQITFEVQ